MPVVFKPKRSSTAAAVPTTSDLVDGEWAVNTADKKIYVRSGASIVEVANAVSVPSGNTVVTALTSASGVLNINCALGDMFTLLLSENITSITFTNLPASGYGTVKSVSIQQPASGGPYAFAKPSSFKAITGSDTAIQTAASARTDLMIKTYDQGTRWAYVMKAVAA